MVVTAGETRHQFCCWKVNNKGFQMDSLGGQANLAFDLLSQFHSESCFSGSVDPTEKPELLVFTDSDFASCPYTCRSTSGVIYLIRTGGAYPVLWSSRKQGSTARSSTEADFIAFANALFGEALNLHEMAECIIDMVVPVKFEQHNQPAITVIRSGYSAKLRHLGRVRKVSIQSVNEQLENNTFNLEYCETSMHFANGFTKIISNGVECQTTLQQLCIQPAS